MCASNQGNEGVHLSTLESFDQDAVEGVVNGVFGSNPFQPPPRRFAMENLVRVDDGSMGLLQASSLWKESLAHIERIVERERLLSAERSDFVARTFRQRPGVVYAVRSVPSCHCFVNICAFHLRGQFLMGRWTTSLENTCDACVIHHILPTPPSLKSLRDPCASLALQVLGRASKCVVPGNGVGKDPTGMDCVQAPEFTINSKSRRSETHAR